MESLEILVYVTNNKDRVLGGDPLTLFILDEQERKSTVKDISLALRADVVQLNNGDYLIISTKV